MAEGYVLLLEERRFEEIGGRLEGLSPPYRCELTDK